jgi:Na+/proline symporter
METARTMGRSALVDFDFGLTDPARKWSIWGALPHMVLAMLSFYVADQISAQRFLTTKSLQDARRSFVLNCVSITVMVPLLIYAGVVLLAYYQDKSKWQETIPPKWVVNVDPATGKAVIDEETGKPLIDWDEKIDGDTIAKLVADGKLIDPNRRKPFPKDKDIGELVDQEDRIIIDKVGVRRPTTKELLFNPKAKDEFLPRYIRRHLPLGLAGLILAALLAASMSSMDSGLNSISTLLIFDFHRRLGWGRAWLAERRGKTVEELDEVDELALARPMVLVIGVAATAFSLLVAQIGDIFTIMVSVVHTFGGPLLGVFLLGMLSRRTTARGAISALLTGTLLALWFTFADTWDLWPWKEKLNDFWPLIFTIAVTLTVGYLVSFLPGPRKSNEELEGLVIGLGHIGQVEPPEATMIIDTSFDEPERRK